MNYTSQRKTQERKHFWKGMLVATIVWVALFAFAGLVFGYSPFVRNAIPTIYPDPQVTATEVAKPIVEKTTKPAMPTAVTTAKPAAQAQRCMQGSIECSKCIKYQQIHSFVADGICTNKSYTSAYINSN